MPRSLSTNIIRTPQHPLHALNERERQFALFIVEGKSQQMAMRLAGYSDLKWQDRQSLAKSPRMQAAITFLRKKNEQSIVASRKKVLQGFLDAIEQAKLLSEPMVQIAGWREIGKMCGYYAPEVKEVNVTVGAKRVIGQLEVLSDKELLELIEKDREVIEAEAVEILSESRTEGPTGDASVGDGESGLGAPEFDSLHPADEAELRSGLGASGHRDEA